MAEQNKEEYPDPQTGNTRVEVKAGANPGSVGSIDPRIAEATRGYDQIWQTYQEMIDSLNRPETQEERLKRERREKSRGVMKSLADGLSALSSLYYTTQYAPETYDGNKTQYGAYQIALDRAKAERDKNDQAYFNLALKMGDLQNQRAKTVREMEAEAARERIANANLQIALNRDARDADLHEGKKEEQAGKARKALADAGISELKYANAPTELANKNKLDEEKAGTERSKQRYYRSGAVKNQAQANEANVRAAHVGEDKYITVTGPDGNEVRIYDSELDDLYQGASEETRARYNQEDTYNESKTPTKEQLRQVAADHVRANGKTKKSKGKASPTGGSTKKKSPTS